MRSDLAAEPPLSLQLPRRPEFFGPLMAAGFFLWRWLWLLGAGCVALAVLSPAPVLGQQLAGLGSISGSVLNNYNGEPLAGITVTLRGSTLAVVTGANGRFSLPEVPAGEHVVSFSKSGYQRTVIAEVKVLPGQTSPVEARLNPEFHDMDEYEVVAQDLDERPEGVLLVERQQSINFVEAISAERFAKLGAGDASEIMTKVTGVTTVEGKYAVVRGLSDRYNMTVLNGGELPTSDPYRRSVPLDLFPSDVIQNVVVNKTFTPDLPGGFAGAATDIITKSFPERFVLKFSLGLGYNTQSTFNDNYLTYPGGGLDAFGMDDGTRALPDELAGLGPDELRRVKAAAENGGNTPAQRAAAAARMDNLTRSFGTPYMGPTTMTAPVDYDFNFLLGDTIKLGENQLGYFASVNYERDYRFYEDAIRARYNPDTAGQSPPPVVQEAYSGDVSETKAQWSGLVNLAYRLNERHELAFNFLYSQVGEDFVRQQVGQVNSSGLAQLGTEELTYRNTLYYNERNLTSYQLKGHHELEALKLDVDWLAGLANTSQDEPDLRYLNLTTTPDPANPAGPLSLVEWGQNYTPSPFRPTRYFRQLEDQDVNARLDLTRPVEDGRGLEWKIKTGLFGSQWERAYNERVFFYGGDPRSGLLVDPVTYAYNFMLGTNAPPPQNEGRYYSFTRYLESDFANTFYDGLQTIEAVYGMVEIPLVESLRLVGGARYESTLLEVTSSVFQSTEVVTGVIDQQDVLPAVNLTWNLSKGMNLRASYAETVARPTFREFAPYQAYDPVTDDLIVGNSFLTMSAIQNFDMRWEWFTAQGGLLSVGGFYKILQAPIEKYSGEVDPTGNLQLGDNKVTYFNGGEATLWGVEFETRQNLTVLHSSLNPFSVGFNFAWISSEIENLDVIQQIKFTNTGRAQTTRPLYDQSPYILNVDLTYEHVRSGTTVTLAYYYAAERLYLITQSYDVYEQGAPQLDLVITQQLSKNCRLKFGAKNLLNPEFIRSYNYNSPTDTAYIFSSYTKGTTFGLSFSYEF